MKWEMQCRGLSCRESHLAAKVPWMSPRPGKDEARSELKLSCSFFFLSLPCTLTAYSHINTHPTLSRTSRWRIVTYFCTIFNYKLLFFTLIQTIFKSYYRYEVNFRTSRLPFIQFMSAGQVNTDFHTVQAILVIYDCQEDTYVSSKQA